MIATDHDKATRAAWGPDALREVREARRKQQEGKLTVRKKFKTLCREPHRVR